MKTACIQTSTGTYKIIKEGISFLGLQTGVDSHILKSMSRNTFLDDKGIVWKDSNTVPWNITNIYIQKGEIVPYGEWIPGKTLADKTLIPDDVLYITELLYTLSKQGSFPRTLSATGIYLGDDSSILLFPENILDFLHTHQDEDYKMLFIDSYRHPDLQGEKAVCFFLGVITYQMVAGHLPYKGDSLTDLREVMRKTKPVPPLYWNNRVGKDLSDLIMKALHAGSSGITVKRWKEVLERIHSEGFYETETMMQSGTDRRKAVVLEEKQKKKYTRNRFLTKHTPKLVVTAVSLLIMGVILFTPIKKALAPPVTAGMTPAKVVQLYYDSINNLDTETLDDCTSSKTGEKDIKEVTGMYVISKVRTGYEGKSGLIQANQWLSSGQKQLEADESIYGLTDILVKKISENMFRVTYTKWYTEREDTPVSKNKPGVPQSIRIIDTVHLTKNKNVWIIDKIDRSTESD